MNFEEATAKSLLANRGIKIPHGFVVTTAVEAGTGAEALGSVVIKAQVPMAEMLTYEQQLTSATGGRGSYHMEFSHYEEVPAHLHGKIISEAKAARGEQKEEAE